MLFPYICFLFDYEWIKKNVPLRLFAKDEKRTKPMKIITHICNTILLVLFAMNVMAQPRTEKKKFFALGDSYTIGESVPEDQRWPVQLVSILNNNGFNFQSPRIIATTGWRTDDLKRAIVAANPEKNYDLVSLLIGVNNQYQGKSADAYAPEFEELLNMAITFAGGDKSKVFVVSIPDYGFTPFGKEKQTKISAELDEFNRINKMIADKYQISYFNITPISRQGFVDPELVASDNLHPSGKQYSKWVDMIYKGLKIR
jgi:lysophospholipase L1-like esterase